VSGGVMEGLRTVLPRAYSYLYTGTLPGNASGGEWSVMARDDLQLLQGTLDVLVL
jgi:hypothetical protein